MSSPKKQGRAILKYTVIVFTSIVLTVILIHTLEIATTKSPYPVFAVPTLRDANLNIEVVATGLSSPTSMAFIGPNDILVLEKNKGTVQRIKNGVLLPQPLLDVNVATNSERGMLGIDVVRILTPILPPSARLFNLFLYYTESQSVDGGPALANRLYKYSFIDDPRFGTAMGRVFGPKLLLDLPVTPGPNHNGGTVLLDPIDKHVYTVIGDLNRQTKAQNFENGPDADLTGGILRVTQDGSTVGGIIGNNHPLNKYFAYGIRNSFGFDFDPVTGKIWDTENGPATNDEINLVEPGFNSGWQDLMGIAPSGFDFNNLVSFGGTGIYRDPEFVWADTVAPTAIKFLNSNQLGSQYQNDIFVGDINNGRIYNFDLNPARTGLVLTGVLSDKIANTDAETQDVIFGEGFEGVTDLKVGPVDGHLYVLSFGTSPGTGTIYKIAPV